MGLDEIVFGHITPGMLLMFVLGVLSLFLLSWKYIDQEIQHGDHTHKKYMRLTWPNALFHVVASFAVLMILHELIEPLAKFGFTSLGDNVLSLIVGLSGSVIITLFIDNSVKFYQFIIEKFKVLFNKN